MGVLVLSPGRTGARGRVTVVVTCFNGERWIQRALHSVLHQSYPDRELVVVDDASTDGSVALLAPYAAMPGVQLVLHRENRGIPATKNVGIARASGEYVAFLEQDDEWHPDKLARQVAAFEAHPDVAMVHTAAYHVNDRHVRRDRWRPRPVPTSSPAAALRAVLQRNPVISVSSAAIRRSCLEDLGGFDERYRGADDYDLWLRIAGRFPIALLEEPLVFHRTHARSFSWRHPDLMLEDALAVVDRAVDRHPSLQPLRNRTLARIRLSHALQAFERGTSPQPLQNALRALRLAPGLWHVYPALALLMAGHAGRALLRCGRRAQQAWQSRPVQPLPEGRSPAGSTGPLA